MSNNKYTPTTIDIFFTIPLYQRLFEWEQPQILQLLNDLYSNFKKDKTSPYYIGMLTVFKGNGEERYSLVDGQQRFTVLTLMGIVFGWNDFLFKEKMRLHFSARSRDQKYIESVLSNGENEEKVYINRKMEAGIKCIQKFVNNHVLIDDLQGFKDFIFEKTTFFISELPQSYTIQDLNRYFEAMNEAGKGLENHEILKVLLLKKVNSEKYDEYTSIWNSVSDMDKCLIRQKEQEKQEDFKKRYLDVVKNGSFKNVFGEGLKNDDKVENKDVTIKGIILSSKKPQEKVAERSEWAILSFTSYILQILWISLEKNQRKDSTNFFNKNKLLETFDKYITSNHVVDVDLFFTNLLRYRLLFDYYVLRLNSNDERNVTYSLNHVTDEGNYAAKRNLLQYQSMLYVSTDSHLWLTAFFEYINSNDQGTIEDSLNFLIKWDNLRLNNNTPLLEYGSIQRYWFWRLDYYLWIDRDNHFENDAKSKKIADNYIFRANRSIEHIAPQHPQRETKAEVDDSVLHKFGNLALISAGQNSALQNETFEVKRAYVDSFINESVGGSIHSLKLLKIYKFDKWNKASIESHHNEMLQILINSFNSDLKSYSEIQTKLKENLIDPIEIVQN